MTRASLDETLGIIGPAAIAVSGGIDSLTLACIAAALIPDTTIFHAVSPAVPIAATDRVKLFAHQRRWNLHLIDAEEFANPRYRENPVNRCYFCKGNLYGRIAKATDLPILSGTNLDDLKDFRPGLVAAQEHGVRHPYVEAAIDKDGIRRLARGLGLGAIAELPSSPCLSSRVTTGLRIQPEELRTIDRVEMRLRDMLGNGDLRCRKLPSGFNIEIEKPVLDALPNDQVERLLVAAQDALSPNDTLLGVSAYIRGNAFIRVPENGR